MKLTLFLLGVAIAVAAARTLEEVEEDHSDEVVNGEFGPIAFLPKLDSQIINGEEAKKNFYPYVGVLGRDGGFHCGSSLIHKQFVLTAAHCAKGRSGLTVYLGKHDRSQQEPTSKLYRVAKVIPHEEYVGRSNFWKNDLALLKLESPVEFTPAIQAIHTVHKDDNQFVGTNATLTGWGRSRRGLPSKLQKAVLPVISNEECLKRFPSRWGVVLDPSHMCVFTPERSPCSGDSGSPLVLTGTDGKGTHEIGLTSWGASVCINYPMVFTRLSKHIDWIKKNIDANL